MAENDKLTNVNTDTSKNKSTKLKDNENVNKKIGKTKTEKLKVLYPTLQNKNKITDLGSVY